MELKEILPVSNILIDIEAENREEIIKVMSKRLLTQGVIKDVDDFYERVIEREKLGITNAGNHIRLPHGISDQVKQVAVVMARTKEKIEWAEDDPKNYEADKMAKLIVLFAVPLEEDKNQEIRYIYALKMICRSLANDKIVNQIMNASSADEIYKMLVDEVI